MTSGRVCLETLARSRGRVAAGMTVTIQVGRVRYDHLLVDDSTGRTWSSSRLSLLSTSDVRACVGGVLGGSRGVQHMVSFVERLLPLFDRCKDGSAVRCRVIAQCLGDVQLLHGHISNASQGSAQEFALFVDFSM